MAVGALLLREPTTSPLTSLVQQALAKKPPFPSYTLRLDSDHLQLHLLLREAANELDHPTPLVEKQQLPQRKHPPVNYPATKNASKHPAITVDEGFESDIDSVSLLSSEDGNGAGTSPVRSHETDSANGSAASDSDDTESPTSAETEQPKGTEEGGGEKEPKRSEEFDLVECMCYADVTVPDLLIFVIKEEVLVVRFENRSALEVFYKNFSTLKAISNQKAYGRSLGGATKFNLLQRTDENGVTHIQVTREVNIAQNGRRENTEKPPMKTEPKKADAVAKESVANRVSTFQRRSTSSENILDDENERNETRTVPERFNNYSRTVLRKVWNSAEDLLDSPQRPERRKKPKGKAPEPPASQFPKDDVYKGQYLRVNVATAGHATLRNPLVFARTKVDSPKITKPMQLQKEKHPSAYLPKATTTNSKTYQQFKYTTFTSRPETAQNKSNWTNSVPRFFKKNRSRSETRNVTPMAYRYVDTTQKEKSADFGANQNVDISKSVANRLFGMSSKLRDFSTSVPYSINTLGRSSECSKDVRESRNFLCRSSPEFYGKYSDGSLDFEDRSGRSSLADLTLRLGQGANSLKSVIKKNDKKKKPNEKKVTFSAYTTVQVV